MVIYGYLWVYMELLFQTTRRRDSNRASDGVPMSLFGYLWEFMFFWVFMVIYELKLGSYEYVWVWMGIYGYVWVYMGIKGCFWVYTSSICGKNTFGIKFRTPELPFWCSDFSVTYES